MEEVGKGPWLIAEPITRLETRALLRCLQRAIAAGDAGGRHLLILGDNLGCVLCVDRCRAKSFHLLSLIRKIGALCFLHNVRLHVRWIPSERNASDEASRHFDPVSEAGQQADTVATDTGSNVEDISKRRRGTGVAPRVLSEFYDICRDSD